MTKRALCIGINYPGTSSQLAGCVNDATDWLDAFNGRGFDEGIGITDGSATRARMLEKMSNLVGETGPDDLAVIAYSGHGSWQPDRDGDEADRRDEVICPVDYNRAGMITDDDLYKVFTSGHRWARVVFISDSCFSGTVNRLAGPLGGEMAPMLQINRPLVDAEEAQRVRDRFEESLKTQRPIVLSGDVEVVPQMGPSRRAKFLPPAAWLPEDEVDIARRVEAIPSRGRPRASALLLAACQDTQVAYDAWFNGRANGAFTYAALQALAENPTTYRDWQRGINRRLPSVDYDQRPQLEGGSGQRRWLTLEETGER